MSYTKAYYNGRVLAIYDGFVTLADAQSRQPQRLIDQFGKYDGVAHLADLTAAERETIQQPDPANR
jgi:hypothetical protein